MGKELRTLVLKAESDGKTLAFFFEQAGAAIAIPSLRQKILELPLYGKDLKWRQGIASLVGNIVLGALDLFPPQTESEAVEAGRKNLAMIAKLEEEERQGQWDAASLATRAELEFVQYTRTGDLQHFIKGEALYRRLADAGSEEHLQIIKNWDSERERRLRRG